MSHQSDLQHAFPGQEKNEPIFIFARQYWLAFIPTALIFLILIFAAVSLQIALSTNALFPLEAEVANAGILFLGGFQLFAILVFLVALLDFYFDIIIVTDRRLVDIDQEQLFFRRISELALEDVEDATSTEKGFFQSFFTFGTVEVQTSGTRSNFEVPNIKHTRQVAALILDLASQAAAGVPEEKRYPHGQYAGFINHVPMTSAAELEAASAILHEDVSRFK